MNSEFTTVSGSSPLDILATFTDTILAVASTASFVQPAIRGVSTQLSSRKCLSSSLVGGSFQNTSNVAPAILFSATNNASLFTMGALATLEYCQSTFLAKNSTRNKVCSATETAFARGTFATLIDFFLH
jgi:hypothetical protein